MDVRVQSAAVLTMAEDWALVDALLGGTKTMRAAGKKYLPHWPAEAERGYQSRLATATLFPAYSRTVAVLTGKPFAKPITIGEDVPARMLPWLENVDLQNRNLHSFAADICREAIAYGLSGILVDCPPSNGAKSVADEAIAGIRPYFVHISPGNILGWRVAMIAGNSVLTQLRLLERIEEDDGPFGTKTVEQVRVLEIGTWTVYRKVAVNGVDTWVIHAEGVTSLSVIPFVPVYGFRKAFMVGTPPMIELCHASVEHWQSKSDQQTILHVARVPILFAKGLGDVEIKVGADAFIGAEEPHADMKYVEHSGAAIEAGRMSLLDLEDRMRQAGAELLVIKPGNTTEVQTVSDTEQSSCDLQRIMQSVEDSLDQALDFMAQFIGEPDGGKVSIYRDFGAATLAEASAALLFGMKSTGALSHETLLSELKRRGILSPDIDIDEEITRAQAEAPPPVDTTELVKP